MYLYIFSIYIECLIVWTTQYNILSKQKRHNATKKTKKQTNN